MQHWCNGANRSWFSFSVNPDHHPKKKKKRTIQQGDPFEDTTKPASRNFMVSILNQVLESQLRYKSYHQWLPDSEVKQIMHSSSANSKINKYSCNSRTSENEHLHVYSLYKRCAKPFVTQVHNSYYWIRSVRRWMHVVQEDATHLSA